MIVSENRLEGVRLRDHTHISFDIRRSGLGFGHLGEHRSEPLSSPLDDSQVVATARQFLVALNIPLLDIEPRGDISINGSIKSVTFVQNYRGLLVASPKHVDVDARTGDVVRFLFRTMFEPVTDAPFQPISVIQAKGSAEQKLESHYGGDWEITSQAPRPTWFMFPIAKSLERPDLISFCTLGPDAMAHVRAYKYFPVIKLDARRSGEVERLATVYVDARDGRPMYGFLWGKTN